MARASRTGRWARSCAPPRRSLTRTPPRTRGPSFAALIGEAADADELPATVASVIGLAADTVPQDDVFWAVRRLFERLAEPRPLVIVIEDLHWAEADAAGPHRGGGRWARDVPLLLLCTARPDLIEVRPGVGRRQA